MMNLRDRMKQPAPLLFDGGMGTLYAQRSRLGEQSCEQACLQEPETILAIHRDYLTAGAQCLKTNTFGLSGMLARGMEADVLLRAACGLIKEAAEGKAYLFGDIGPAPDDCGAKDSALLYIRQMETFLSEGITCFLMETLPASHGVAEAAAWLKARCPEAYLIVSYAVDPAGVTRGGESGVRLLRDTAAMPQVDAVGMNCVSGPGHMLKLVQQLPDLGKPLSVMPNAGYPAVIGRRAVFQGTPDYFADLLGQLAGAGAAIVGGCCGTTPEHIRAAGALIAKNHVQYIPHAAAQKASAAARERTGDSLLTRLKQGRRVIAV
ncbi:MAG: homocysteine S-methyltransferase family protein [Clostridia bacterium]|nr:homocysteine S-methyltransferase family protein [Clostridia bacterium]